MSYPKVEIPPDITSIWYRRFVRVLDQGIGAVVIELVKSPTWLVDLKAVLLHKGATRPVRSFQRLPSNGIRSDRVRAHERPAAYRSRFDPAEVRSIGIGDRVSDPEADLFPHPPEHIVL